MATGEGGPPAGGNLKGTALTVLLVRADRWTRGGLAQLLAGTRVTLHGAADEEEAITRYAPDGAPDVIFLSGVSAVAEVRDGISRLLGRFPSSKLFLLAEQTLPDQVMQAALGAGAAGVILKDLTSDELLAALHQALAGLTVLPLAAAWPLMSSEHRARCVPDGRTPPGKLSPKEWQILERLVLGMTNKEIAQEFGIAEGTVKVHLRAILQKTKKRNRTEAALWALRLMQQADPARLS